MIKNLFSLVTQTINERGSHGKHSFSRTPWLGNMSTLEDSVSEPPPENSPPVVVEPMEDNPATSDPKECPLGDQPEPAEKSLLVKRKKLRSYRQKAQALQARITYREKVIKGIQHHLKKGTFPKRFKSLKPYPKMDSPDTQAIVNEACQQVEYVILDQMILDEEKKLTQERAEYQALKELRLRERTPQVKTLRKPPKITVTQLRQELTDLQSKYVELSTLLSTQQEKP